VTQESWQEKLVSHHKEVFLRSFRGVPFAPGFPTCPDGWREIVATLVQRVAVAAVGYPVHFSEISEKYGALRVYWAAEARLPERMERTIEHAVALAEARSQCTCASCGAEGRLVSSGGWLFTACSQHARGAPVPVQWGMENLHIVRGSGDGIITCQRYDRANDRLVDVDPRDLGRRRIPRNLDSFFDHEKQPK
jgi:hypothetical protein